MADRYTETLVTEIIETETTISLGQLCRSCGVPAEWITRLVAEGVIEPATYRERWRFAAVQVPRVHAAARLQRDLGVNVAGLALALELMDDIQTLRERLDALAERQPPGD